MSQHSFVEPGVALNPAVQHHPDDSMLLAHAAGATSGGAALVLATHVEGCMRCRAQMREYEALGGAMLEATGPATMQPDALARTLARIDAEGAARAGSAQSSAASSQVAHSRVLARLPNDTPWPRSMQGCSVTRWSWIGPGMRWSRVTLPHDLAANVFLLRIAAGKCLPPHTHSEVELTQVLYGAFHDGRAMFGPGDFDAADGDIHHQPIVQQGDECVCLASVKGRVLFDGAIARMLGSLVGM